MATTRQKTQNSISSAGKVGILCAVFGIPALFFATSYGLSVLFDVAPYAVVLVLVAFATAYTAQTSALMYQFYDVDPPVLRFIPCLCEITLLDLKYHIPCYILYVAATFFIGMSLLPYSIMKILGENLATSLPFYLMAIGFVLLGARP